MTTETKVRVAPNSKESEMMVLGCMLTSINSLNVAADALDNTDFYYTEHKTIFDSLKKAYKNDKPADVHLICEDLKSKDKLQSIGGPGYITTLAQYAGTSAHIEEYCRIIKQKATLRQMIDLAQNIEKKALDDPNDFETLLEDYIKRADKIKSHYGKTAEKYLYEHLLEKSSEKDVIDEIRNTSPGIRVGMKIGNVDLEFPGGAITINAAPTSHGKTTVLVQKNLKS